MDKKLTLLDKRMIIALTFFVVAWAAFNYENQKAMAIHSARLAAAAAAANPSPLDPIVVDTHMEEEDSLLEDEVVVPSDMNARRMGSSTGKILPLQSPEKFSGVLKEVNTGCFADGECYIVVDGKNITVLWGWTNETVGSVRNGEGGIGELEKFVGSKIDVYANRLAADKYTLYGSTGYYVELVK